MILDQKTMRLIAVGASVSANCQPCLQTNLTKALEEGIVEQEIMAASEVGKMVRRGAAHKMDKFITNMTLADTVAVSTVSSECECSS